MTGEQPPTAPPTWREALAQRPRHVLLWALVAGLLCAPAITPAAAAPLALVTCVALRAARLAGPLVALAAAAALVAGTALGDARLAALERHTLPAHAHVAGEATLLAAMRKDARSGARALAELRIPGGARGRVLLRLVDHLDVPERRPGRILAVSGTLRPPDLAARAARAHATLRVRSARATGARRGGLAGLVDRVRDRATEALAAGLPPADGALLQGMVLGQDAAIPDALRDDLRAAGLAHLVAASGQNVLLLAALALAAGALLAVPIRPRLVVVLGLVALYVPLAGAGPSIQRAGVMGMAGLAATLAGRPAARWYAVGLASAVTLALDPRASADPGWQMSFAAVVALALLAAPLSAALRSRGLPRGVAEAAAVALVATLATAPVAALHFGRASLLAVPANVLAAPAVAPVMWLGMAAGAVAQVAPGLAAPLVTLAAPLVAYLRALGTAVAGLPGSETEPPVALVAVTSALVLAALGGLAVRHTRERARAEALADLARGGVDAGVELTVGASARGGLRPRSRRTAAVLLGTALAVAWLVALRPAPMPPAPGPGVLRLTFLDVGQGDATLVQAGGAAVLVDAGPPSAPTAALLRRAGVRRLDALVVSHGASDHLGGAPAVLRDVPTALLLDGRDGDRSPVAAALDPPARAAAVRTVVPHAGQVLRAGPLRLRVLWPPPGAPVPGEDPNDRAVVLEARAGATRALLPADAESPVLARLGLGAVDVLKVAHHGSGDDGLPALLRALTPAVAVVSAGRRNPYGHPAPATISALGGVPRVLRTDRQGTVVVEGRAGRLTVGTGT